jgi:ABC-type sugar transport system permease subunit/ABC-type glycerol-3-phosphate transport system substrate-binding protein
LCQLFILAASLLLLAVFPAQGVDKPRKEPVTLQFGSLWISEGSPKIEWRANSIIVKKFFQDRPNIHLKMINSLVLPPGMNVPGAGLTMAMVGDSAEDVISLQSEEITKAVDQGFLMPLDDYVAKWPQAKYRLTGAVRELCSAIGPDGKKHIYGLPFAISADCLLFNRKRFREAGLKRGPRDWNELWDFGKKLCDAEEDPETGYPRHWAMDVYLEGWFLQQLPPMAGGDWAVQHPDGTWDTRLTSKPVVRSMQFLEKLCWGDWTDARGKTHKGITEMSRAATQGGGQKAQQTLDQRDLFESGIVAMQANAFWSAFNERIAKDPQKFGIVPFPKYPGPEGKYVARIGGTVFGIKSTLKNNKKVADAAWEYITYICGDESEKEKVKYFVDNGVARYVNPGLLRKYGYPQRVIDQVPKDWAIAYKEIYASARVLPSPPGLPSILAEMSGPTKDLIRPGKHDIMGQLNRVQAVVSRSYLYTPSQQQMARNGKIAFVVVIVLILAMVGGGVHMLRTQMRENTDLTDERDKVYRRKIPASKHLLAWAFLAPAIISVFLWQYIPVGWGSVMAFLNVHIMGGSDWVGLDNFVKVAMRPLFWLAWKNTLIFVGLSLAMGFAAPITLALLLSEIPKGKTLFRTLYYLPALTTGIVTILLWQRFYDPTEYGLMNRILLSLNGGVLVHLNHLFSFLHLPWQVPLIHAQQWLLNPRLAMAACILPGVWGGMGPGCIIYLAALKAVPEEQYDAADLDGAGIFQKAWHVTLPAIFPLVLINFIGAFIGAFHGMQGILVMTGGGPDHATHVIGLELWYQSYVLANYGQSTAIAWMLASLLVGFVVMQMRIVGRMKFSTAEQKE